MQITVVKSRVRIGGDSIDFAIQSDRAGYVYVAMAGSDNKSIHLLFPNDLDQNNKAEAGQQMLLPRPNWRLEADEPTGINNLLILVSDGPRDLRHLGGIKAGAFLTSLNNAGGRNKLGGTMIESGNTNEQEFSMSNWRDKPVCSDAFSAAMVKI